MRVDKTQTLRKVKYVEGELDKGYELAKAELKSSDGRSKNVEMGMQLQMLHSLNRLHHEILKDIKTKIWAGELIL